MKSQCDSRLTVGKALLSMFSMLNWHARLHTITYNTYNPYNTYNTHNYTQYIKYTQYIQLYTIYTIHTIHTITCHLLFIWRIFSFQLPALQGLWLRLIKHFRAKTSKSVVTPPILRNGDRIVFSWWASSKIGVQNQVGLQPGGSGCIRPETVQIHLVCTSPTPLSPLYTPPDPCTLLPRSLKRNFLSSLHSKVNYTYWLKNRTLHNRS